MFTGIVQGTAKVASADFKQDNLDYTIILPAHLLYTLTLGASVSINGTCQTVTSIHDDKVSFTAIPETLSKTTLSELKVGDLVNVERSLRIGDEIGGHMLSGHIFGKACINSIEAGIGCTIWKISVPKEWTQYLIKKGYVAIDGASLTVVEVCSDSFSVHLIPHTIAATTFQNKKEGDLVNIEFDSITQLIVETCKKMFLERNTPC